ncbi:MAG: hypothetical protein QOJ99_2533 [Bryobacterales bacterium]|jgi:predicted nuclease of predicted toxin-antitoxin system|nr:hypothetical protein [Bryobacterales bacterium]
MTRILLNQGLAPRAAAILRQNGFDAVHIAEIGMERAEDILIPDMAPTEKRICVTLDHDFHAHLATAGHGVLPFILLRAEGLDAQSQADLIRLVCLQCQAASDQGAAISADCGRIRVGRLPLG